jgi:hypothetical protein
VEDGCNEDPASWASQNHQRKCRMPQKYAKNDEKSGFKHRKWFDSIAIINQPSLTIINHH